MDVQRGPATSLVAVQAARRAAGAIVQHELRAPVVIAAAAAAGSAYVGVASMTTSINV